MISLDNISVAYSGQIAVTGFSAQAEPGEFIALVGPNGSGKSSLIKAIAGLLPFDGVCSVPAVAKARARQLAYLGQNCTAPNGRKVKDIIALGRTPFLGPLSKHSSEDTLAIEHAAALCEIEALLDREFGTLSGGERMRVHLGRTLATRAPILLADEPITALDPYYQISIMNILRKTADQGTIVIAALHDLSLAKRMADRIWVLHSGHLISDDIPKRALSADILKTVFRVTPDGEICL